MGIQLGSNFTVNTALPLDDRMVVANLTDRNAILSGRRYEGLLVYVVSESTNYQLVGGITDTDWQELSGSGGSSSSTSGVVTLANNATETVLAIGDFLTNAAAFVIDYYLYRRVDGVYKRISGRIFLEGVNDAPTNPEKWQLFEAIRSEVNGPVGVTFGLDDVDTEKSCLTITLDDLVGSGHLCKFYYTFKKLSTGSNVVSLANSATTALTNITGSDADIRASIIDYYIYRRNDSTFKTRSGKLFIESIPDESIDADKWQIFEAETSEAFGVLGSSFTLTNPASGEFLLNVILDDLVGTGHDCKIYFNQTVLSA